LLDKTGRVEEEAAGKTLKGKTWEEGLKEE
jgi:hypothetical protein